MTKNKIYQQTTEELLNLLYKRMIVWKDNMAAQNEMTFFVVKIKINAKFCEKEVHCAHNQISHTSVTQQNTNNNTNVERKNNVPFILNIFFVIL